MLLVCPLPFCIWASAEPHGKMGMAPGGGELESFFENMAMVAVFVFVSIQQRRM
jgi:hypothetical protein